jgi:hypothetical protein
MSRSSCTSNAVVPQGKYKMSGLIGSLWDRRCCNEKHQYRWHRQKVLIGPFLVIHLRQIHLPPRSRRQLRIAAAGPARRLTDNGINGLANRVAAVAKAPRTIVPESWILPGRPRKTMKSPFQSHGYVGTSGRYRDQFRR